MKQPAEVKQPGEAQAHPRFNKEYMQKAFDLAMRYTEATLAGKNKAINFYLPDEIYKQVDLKIGEDPLPDDELLQLCEKILDLSVKPYHPHFHNTLFGGFDQYAISGAMLTPFVNGSMYTY